jgi:hypothetical protein
MVLFLAVDTDPVLDSVLKLVHYSVARDSLVVKAAGDHHTRPLRVHSVFLKYHYSVARDSLIVKVVGDHHTRPLRVHSVFLKHHFSVSRECLAARPPRGPRSYHPPVMAVRSAHLDLVLPLVTLHGSAPAVHVIRSCSPTRRKDWPVERMGYWETSLVGRRDWL